MDFEEIGCNGMVKQWAFVNVVMNQLP